MSVKRALVAVTALLALAGCGANTSTSATTLAAAPTWAPDGMKPLGDGVAGSWVPISEVQCKAYQSTCWGLNIASEFGCPGGYYVQIAISTADGTIVDSANDITAAIPANGRARVVLSPPTDPPANAQATVSKLNCLGD